MGSDATQYEFMIDGTSNTQKVLDHGIVIPVDILERFEGTNLWERNAGGGLVVRRHGAAAVAGRRRIIIKQIFKE